MSRFEALDSFVAVVAFTGFGNAAEKLGIAKSMVSRRVSDLERRLGVQLLLRTTRRQSLTDAGREAVESDPKGPPWERFETHEMYASLKETAFGVAHAVTQVARTGTEAQIAKTREILEEARRQIYQLLADDED